MKNIIILLVIAILTACASSVRELRGDYSRHEAYTIEENYQVIYRRLATMTDQCYSSGGRTHIYTDVKKGNMSYNNHGYGILLAVDLRGKGDTTKVDIYSGFITRNSNVDDIYEWLIGIRRQC
jgi:hypothetical protein